MRLRTLNRYSARLPSLSQAPVAVPFDIYVELRELLGELAAFASTADACPYTELERSIFEFMHQRLSGGKETAPYLAALLQMPPHVPR